MSESGSMLKLESELVSVSVREKERESVYE